MQPLRRAVLRPAGQLRTQMQTSSRRHKSHDAHGSHHAGATTEPLGAAFLITAAAIPVSIAIYTFSRQGTDEVPYFTRYIRDTYNEYATKWAKRNETHTRAVEQAAADRTLFLNNNLAGAKWVDHRNPEQLNGGSPWNVPAGHNINLDQVIEKYQREAREHDEVRRQQLKDNAVPIEQAYTPEWRGPTKKE